MPTRLSQNSNFLSLQAKVTTNTGRPDKSSVAADGLNQGIYEMCKRHNWEEVETMDGQVDIGIKLNDTQCQLPQNVYHIVEARLLTPNSPLLSYAMFILRKREFVRRFPNVVGYTISGRPYWCYRQGNQLFFDRKSNDSYTIRLTCMGPETFYDSNDVCSIRGSDLPLISYATHYVYQSIQMYDDAKYWLAKFEKECLDLINFERREIGVNTTARPWQRRHPISVNEPWLDPFIGHDNGAGYQQ